MGLRDRLATPTTAAAILSWRIVLGIAVAFALGAAGLPLGVAVGVGAGVYVGAVALALPRDSSPYPSLDPFTLSEPWRQIVQRAQTSRRKLRETVEAGADGPLKQTLRGIADQLDRGLAEAWEVARRGDEIDDAIRRLDPTALRSRLATAERLAAERPSPDADAAVESLNRQLELADRLRARSEDAAASLRFTQSKLDELVARASEVRIGAVDTDAYRREVDDLVIQLEALHLAVEDVDR
jgi:hypothetical protein